VIASTTPHDAEYRRCLVQMDVPGMMRVWAHTAPHLPQLDAAQTMAAMHIARVDMKYLSRKLKDYSIAWLAERGIRKIDGQWVDGLPPQNVIAEAVGIAVRSKYPAVGKRIAKAMNDALENSRAKGVIDAPMQREAMLAARAKVRFKLRMA